MNWLFMMSTEQILNIMEHDIKVIEHCGHVTMIKRSRVMSNAVVLKLFWDSGSLFILIRDHLI